MPVFKLPGKSIAAICCLTFGAGCATVPRFAPTNTLEPESFVQHAADLLINGVAYTRANTREVAGWCWSDKETGKLVYVGQAGVGEYQGVGVTVPTEQAGSSYVSCSWHTHPWGPHVAPGPSGQDLRNSMLPQVSGMAHFVLDQHGIWKYANGRVTEMCPWNRTGTGFDTASCRAGSHKPTTTSIRVERFYGRRN
jgi:hypothetical protein